MTATTLRKMTCWRCQGAGKLWARAAKSLTLTLGACPTCLGTGEPERVRSVSPERKPDCYHNGVFADSTDEPQWCGACQTLVPIWDL